MGLCDDGIRKIMQNKTEKHPVVKYYQVVECVCHFEHVVPVATTTQLLGVHTHAHATKYGLIVGDLLPVDQPSLVMTLFPCSSFYKVGALFPCPVQTIRTRTRCFRSS
jgi:hypothetical protein